MVDLGVGHRWRAVRESDRGGVMVACVCVVQELAESTTRTSSIDSLVARLPQNNVPGEFRW